MGQKGNQNKKRWVRDNRDGSAELEIMEYSNLNGPREANTFKTGSKNGTGDPFLAVEGTCAGKIASNFNIFLSQLAEFQLGANIQKGKLALDQKTTLLGLVRLDTLL